MHILETKASSEKQALELSSQYLGIQPSEIQVKIGVKGTSGFLGFGEKTPHIYYVLPIENKTPMNAIISGITITILNKMGLSGKVFDIRKTEEDKTLVILKSQTSTGSIIGKDGRTLEALQTLINVVVEKNWGQFPKIILDIANYRDRHAKKLESLALSVAKKVIESGKSKLLHPMNPFERRIIHLALQDHEFVSTESLGSGSHKKMRIFLKQSLDSNNILEEPATTEEDTGYDEAILVENNENMEEQENFNKEEQPKKEKNFNR